MKAEDIIKEEEISEDECGVCCLHDAAIKKFGNSIVCPCCGKEIDTEKEDLTYNMELRVVGETNSYNPADQNVENMYVVECPHCKRNIGFKAIPIIYNGNHDIYYTGGRNYVPTINVKLPDSVKTQIENYTERIKAGENLDALNLEIWIKHDIESYIAETLYKAGLKY